ncbi:MAG: chorismate synthase, partial [Tissierellia bacterium]|nr:chorismate synthase [Tissierellia bacterium]
VAENVFAHILANELMIKFGGDSLGEMMGNYKSYMEGLKKR